MSSKTILVVVKEEKKERERKRYCSDIFESIFNILKVFETSNMGKMMKIELYKKSGVRNYYAFVKYFKIMMEKGLIIVELCHKYNKYKITEKGVYYYKILKELFTKYLIISEYKKCNEKKNK